jgi:arylsulfatase A-like enzyme
MPNLAYEYACLTMLWVAGTVVAAMKQRDMWGNTLMVVLSDNGAIATQVRASTSGQAAYAGGQELVVGSCKT